MSFEQQAYELPEIWHAAWFTLEDERRFQALSQLIPQDVQTLLDAGCGNGMFVNALQRSSERRFTRIAAVDRSAAALAHVGVARGRASIDALPFGDRSFDLVTSMEVWNTCRWRCSRAPWPSSRALLASTCLCRCRTARTSRPA